MLLTLDTDEPGVLESPWFIRFWDERVIDTATNPRTRRWLIVSTSPDIGEGIIINNAGPFWVNSSELEKQLAFWEHVIGLQNEKTVPKPRNVNQTRDGTGKFVRKNP